MENVLNEFLGLFFNFLCRWNWFNAQTRKTGVKKKERQITGECNLITQESIWKPPKLIATQSILLAVHFIFLNAFLYTIQCNDSHCATSFQNAHTTPKAHTRYIPNGMDGL